MGRHAKFFGDETGFADPAKYGFAGPAEYDGSIKKLPWETQPNEVYKPVEPAPAPVPAPVSAPRAGHRMSWIGRTPLMPVLAGIAATGVIAAAFSTRQISLNFAGGEKLPAIGQAQASVPPPEAAQTQDAPSANRSIARSPLTVRFKVVPLAGGGFNGVVAVRNTTAKPLSKWLLAFQIPNAAVVSVTGAKVKTDGKNGTVVLFGSNVDLAPGQAAVVNFKATGAPGLPTTCKINRLSCL